VITWKCDRGHRFDSDLFTGCLMQRSARCVLASSVHISALKLVYTTPPDVDVVKDEPLSVLISIFRNTSGDEWRKC
jgi:hypothetical protein